MIIIIIMIIMIIMIMIMIMITLGPRDGGLRGRPGGRAAYSVRASARAP